MKKWWLFVVLISVNATIEAQYSRHIIELKDKTGTPFNINEPAQFLSQRAIARRTRYHIPIDQTDLPVNPSYIDSIRLSGNVVILNVSKWLNQVCIVTTDAVALAKINNFAFVRATAPLAARPPFSQGPVNKQQNPPAGPVFAKPAIPQNQSGIYQYGAAHAQVDLHNAAFLHNLGFSGQDMQLAMMDAGFFHYNTLPTFDSIRLNHQVLGTWDFVANEPGVAEDNAHGMFCLSTIAANLPGTFVGSSPKCSFYLYRTEDASSEYPVEEQNWVAAAEKADSLGVDVCSISLGYTVFDNSIFNYTYPQLDGNTSIISKGCDLAAKKGMLIVVAVGNEGTSSWKYLTTPADADSILAVGAVNAARQVAAFSSYGPSADGQIKPDVAAIGQSAVIAHPTTGDPFYSNGTSFAAPIMAGIVTCLWQAFPEVNNMTIIEQVRQSADRANMPDDRTGYGIPDVKKAFVSLLKKLYKGQTSMDNNCKTTIAFSIKAGNNMNLVVERKLSTDTGYVAISTIVFTGAFAMGNYTFTDDLPAPLTSSDTRYRLKMNIASDTSFYIDSAIVSPAPACTIVAEKITISPNPVSDQLKVSIAGNTAVAATITIHSLQGKRIYTSTRQVNGSGTFIIPMKQVSSGVYFVTIYTNQKKVLVKKIIRN